MPTEETPVENLQNERTVFSSVMTPEGPCLLWGEAEATAELKAAKDKLMEEKILEYVLRKRMAEEAFGQAMAALKEAVSKGHEV